MGAMLWPVSYRTLFMDQAVVAYAERLSAAPDEIQRDLIETTQALGDDLAVMQIGPVQGAFMTVLTRVLQPRLAVEVGTFTGYSALAVARELPPGARLVCCDLSEEWTAVARRFWARAGVADRIDLRIGPALDTLRALPFDPPVDLAFIDAAKAEYVDYYEELVPRLSERGVILVDNVLWDGLVADPARDDEATEALRAFSAHAAADPRTTVALLPVGDGLSMITRARP